MGKNRILGELAYEGSLKNFMRGTEVFSDLFSIGLIAFILRWGVNWILLNKINSTNIYPWSLKSILNWWPIMKHLAISEWNPWWTGVDFRKWKLASNALSVIVYSCALFLILLLWLRGQT